MCREHHVQTGPDTSDAPHAINAEGKKFKKFEGDKAFPEDIAELFDECEDDERKVKAQKNLDCLRSQLTCDYAPHRLS